MKRGRHCSVPRIVDRMCATDRLELARVSLERREWVVAFAHLSATQEETGLEVEDLEGLALAAYMLGKDDECAEAWMRAHQEWLRRGEGARAARCAFQQALGLFFRGALAPALGWVARGGRVLEEGQESVEQAWLLMLTALPDLFQGDPESVYPIFVQAGQMAERFGDPDASMFARLARGQALILQQRTSEGMTMLDEVMVAVTGDEVSPILAGIAYCQVIDLCHRVFDLRRAREWTEALSRWCDSQPDLVPYRGNCLVHRCEIFRLHGAWDDAFDAAQRACEWLAGPPEWDSLGSAHYQMAEIQRLRGEFAEAERSYRQASQAGREPEPGMSLLRLAQGGTEVALAAIRRVMEERQDPIHRSRMLPAYVEILLASNVLTAARAASDELAVIADRADVPYLAALAGQASGAVLLAEGDPRASLIELRRAYNFWRDLDAPHQAAQVRALIGVACRDLGDAASGELELEGARGVFERLGATPDARRVSGLLGVAVSTVANGLSPREIEVLDLVATGKTNRAIATELFISEKTVARHVSNILTKLGLSSRSEATAYAYKHGMVR